MPTWGHFARRFTTGGFHSEMHYTMTLTVDGETLASFARNHINGDSARPGGMRGGFDSKHARAQPLAKQRALQLAEP